MYVYFAEDPHGGRWQLFREFGPHPNGRFDHLLPPAQPQDRAVLSCAEKLETCLAEAFQRTRTINRVHRKPRLASFQSTGQIELLNLSKEWLGMANADLAIGGGSRDTGRSLSTRIYEEFPSIQGLIYECALEGAVAMTLYERAASALPNEAATDRALNDPMLAQTLQRIASRVDYDFV